MALVSDKRRKLDDQFYKLLRKFKLNEFKEIVLALFEEMTWEVISKAIRKYNLSRRMDDLSKLCLEYVKNFSMDEMRQTYGNLLLYDISLHNSKKTWTAVNMRNSNDIPLNDDIARNIKSSFRKNAKNINIYWHVINDVNWFVIVVVKKVARNKVIHQLPIFIAHPVDTTFLFVAPKNANAESLKLIVAGLGYDDLKIMKLQGKNIGSLMSMLLNNQNAGTVRAETSRALRVISNAPIRTTKGINFCKNKVRETHAKALFGDGSVDLQTLTVNVKTEWRGVRTVPQAEGSSFDMAMRFKAKSVCKSLAHLIHIGAIKEPYPIWAQEFLVSGKNVINIA